MLRLVLALPATFLTASTLLAAGPTVQEPVSPQVQEQGVDFLKKKPVPWKPGDPVRVVPDMREDNPPPTGAAIEMMPPEQLAPGVGPAVTPDLMQQSIKRLPKIKPYEFGDPVRIAPDLREGGVEN